jgi:hypothetical protein
VPFTIIFRIGHTKNLIARCFVNSILTSFVRFRGMPPAEMQRFAERSGSPIELYSRHAALEWLWNTRTTLPVSDRNRLLEHASLMR